MERRKITRLAITAIVVFTIIITIIFFSRWLAASAYF
jgi:hypothetical protein